MRTYSRMVALACSMLLSEITLSANLPVKDDGNAANSPDPYSSTEIFKCRYEWLEGGKNPKFENGTFELFEVGSGSNRLVGMSIKGTQNFNNQWASGKLETGLTETMSSHYSEPPIIGISEQKLTDKKYATTTSVRFDKVKKILAVRVRYLKAGVNAPESTTIAYMGACE